jgi:excisionase family DNA binding protein
MTNLIAEITNKPPMEFGVEPLLTVQYAAKALGIHVWALRRAVKAGTIPAYAPFNGRKLVRLSEVIAYIDSCRQGGVDA